MNEVVFEISNLYNSECKTQVKNALDKLKGVQKVGVSLPEGTVKVAYNEPADEEEIRACIEHTGFEVI